MNNKLNLSKNINEKQNKFENGGSRMKYIGFEELYSDFNKLDRNEDINKGIAINTYQNNIRLNIYDLNLINSNINFKDKEIVFCFDKKKQIKTKGCFDSYPSIDSKKQEEFDEILKFLIKSSHLKVKTHVGTYVTYDISCFSENPPQNGKEIRDKIKRLQKERLQKKIDDF